MAVPWPHPKLSHYLLIINFELLLKKEIREEIKTGNCTVVLGYQEGSGFCRIFPVGPG